MNRFISKISKSLLFALNLLEYSKRNFQRPAVASAASRLNYSKLSMKLPGA
jgi:hypothetical protein